MKKKIQQFLDKSLVIGLSLFVSPAPVGALFENGLTDIQAAICRIRNWIFTLALIIGVIYIIIAAIRYMGANGDAAKVSEGHKALTWAAIGIGVAIIAVGVPGIVSTLLGGSALPDGC